MAFAQSDKMNEVIESFNDYFMEVADKPNAEALSQAEKKLMEALPDTPEAWETFRGYERETGGRLCLYGDANFALGFWLALHPDAIIETITPFWDTLQDLNKLQKARAEAESSATAKA
jgi:hypothetical protein